MTFETVQKPEIDFAEFDRLMEAIEPMPEVKGRIKKAVRNFISEGKRQMPDMAVVAGLQVIAGLMERHGILEQVLTFEFESTGEIIYFDKALLAFLAIKGITAAAPKIKSFVSKQKLAHGSNS